LKNETQPVDYTDIRNLIYGSHELYNTRLEAMMKNSFTKYVDKDTILVLDGKTKFDVLDKLITCAADKSKVDRDIIMRATWKREKMMTTGVGFGLALPHIRLTGIPEPVVLVGLCKEPIVDYQSQDDQPIRVLVFIVAPEGNQEDYLQLLGSISRKLRNAEMIGEIVDNIARPSQVLRILKRRSKEEGESEE